jgi:hypothetical protein
MRKTLLLRLFAYVWALVVLGTILALLIGKAATIGTSAEWLDWGKQIFSRSSIVNWVLALFSLLPAIGAWLLANWLDEKAMSRRR